jgi:hypothetical protein
MPSKKVMGRQFVIEADNARDLPMGYKDLVLIQGLKRRSDLNNRFAEVHGRVRKGTQDVEGITMLTSREEFWIKRSSLLLLGRSFEFMKQACEEHGVKWTEYQAGAAFLEVQSETMNEIVAAYQAKMQAKGTE